MRALFRFLFIILIPLYAQGQSVTLDEHFSDGNFTTAPVWTGDTTDHIIYDENGNYRLRLDAPVEGSSFLTTASSAAYGTWEFLVQFDFNPSSTSYAKIYLLSDAQDISGALNGYFVRVGHTDDEVSLFRQDGSNQTKIIDGIDDLIDDNPIAVRIHVTRDINGNWELLADSTGGTNFRSLGTVNDGTHISSNFFGIYSKYIGSRTSDYYYDDIQISKVNPPLKIVDVSPQNNREIDVVFNIAVDPNSIDIDDFSVNHSIGSPSNITLPTSNTIRLHYFNVLPGNDYSLKVNNIDDTEGNTITPNSAIDFALFDTFADGDIAINEFMYDEPDGLAEYVEIRNTTSKRLNLGNWQIGDANTLVAVSSDTLVLGADEFMVFSEDTTALFNTFGPQNYIQLEGLPGLNNAGDAIPIYTNNSRLVDSLFYSSDWGGSNISLERRSASTPAIYEENWGSSPSADGGTPGQANEVFNDSAPPSVSEFEIVNNKTLRLLFNERVENASAGATSYYRLDRGIGIKKVKVSGPDTANIILGSPLQNATNYTLTISSIEDIFGNTMKSQDVNFTYYHISEADSGNVFINEFTADPPEGMTEYIELYNPTQHSLSLRDWTINDNTGNQEVISSSHFVVPPDSFAVIAPDSSLFNYYSNFSIVVMGSAFPSLNNSGDDIVIRRADGTLLDSLRYTSAWAGSETVFQRRTVDISGIYPENWGHNPRDEGTPGRDNDIPLDKDPPVLESYQILSDTDLRLIFNERLTSSSANAAGNYQLSGSNSISSQRFTNPDTVDLEFQSPLQNSTSYKLYFSGLQDLFGNTSGSQHISFTFYEISEADSGNIFINEFLPDPPGGMTEFIELYNPTEKSFNLKDWTINDNTRHRRTITQSQFVIPPDSFAVIAPDSSMINTFPDVNLLTIGNRFPSLNNSGDDIVLRRADGVLLDSLRYSSTWVDAQLSMERRTTAVSSFYRANWDEAPRGVGSPGALNTVTTDDTAPELEQFRIPDASTIQLVFSETIEHESAVNPENYSFNPEINIQSRSTTKDTVTLFLSEELTSSTTYQISISGLKDIFGNKMSPISFSREYIKFSKADSGDVVINEILYQRAGGSGPEFVELYNRGSENYNLVGWKLGDGSDLIDITAGIHIKAGAYVVLTDNQKLASTKANGYYLPDFPSLNDDEDAVYIRSDRQRTIDSLYYYASWGGSDGISLERKDPAAATNDASNWTTSKSQGGISAGNKNGSFLLDQLPPEPIFSTRRTDGFIEVRFNEFIKLTPDLSFLTGDTKMFIEEFDPTEGNKILLRAAATNTKKSKSSKIMVQNLEDVKGNSTASASIPVGEQVKPGSVVINEIMYNPLSESDDNQPDQSEYIELRNTQDYAISLEGFTLHDAPDENGQTRSLEPVNSTSKYLPPDGHLLVYADEAPNFTESKTAIFFDLKDMSPARTVRIDRGSLSLASRGDAIYLADSSGTTIDSVYYDQSWQNPNIVDTRGIALERINPAGPSGSASNWSSSTSHKGGTPGMENSIFQTPENQPEKIGLSFNPNPFSPDGDGREDNLFINYKLDQPDYLLNVRIFDRYGRLVRELADGKQAGYEGSLQWNGKTDDGNRNRVGIYIILFKAYNSNNGSDQTFKEVVVLARQL